MKTNADLWALLEEQHKQLKDKNGYNSYQWFVGEFGPNILPFRFLKGGLVDNFKSATSGFNKTTGPFKTKKEAIAFITDKHWK